ncbi:UDP-galactose-4-epimerase [Bacillus sp. FJAT-18017]|uniref:UDP-glucose 4-epimerase GalE n=1 Tax=Bacillus sp. FJAT-18017 TaxID=1705566 RepID=UPI0006AFE177|nr:UDP-glucose 4-epimerase GalE [Bacillus sp. FJAT-18017]ALC92526.1 UDP-galactose-4-epimerase [Bacillus sp. FJAT-18017]
MILVTGGAGYIGSHVTKDLLDKGYQVAVLDNLSTGHIQAVDKRALFFFGDLGNENRLDEIFKSLPIKAVMHFSANCLVGESVQTPLKYYQNNVCNTICILNKMLEYNVKHFVFSSTCATYGVPDSSVISENHLTSPINPYGHSKRMIEIILQDLFNSHGLNFVSLRYFNVGGAHFSGEIGEDHKPETHLIPNVFRHLQGKSDYIDVYGDNYNTPDGTCIRDYIHVLDLSRAHILALEYLVKQQHCSEIFNLGNELGHSVLDVIKTCEMVTGKKATIRFLERRAGDPPKLVASSEKIKRLLGWKSKYDLTQIILSAWKWHEKYPDGYENDIQ